MRRVPKICQIAGCSRVVSSDGYCRPHYLVRVLKIEPKLAAKGGLPVGKLGLGQLDDITSRTGRYVGLPVAALDGEFGPVKRSYLTNRELQELNRAGPRTRGSCSLCDQPEARDHLCRHHWLSHGHGMNLRRDIAGKIVNRR